MNENLLTHIFKINWLFTCETPIVVKNGDFREEKIENHKCEISTIYKEPYISENILAYYYKIPSSSFRGALRSFFIENFIEDEFFYLFNEAKESNQNKDNLLLESINQTSENFNFLYYLFGFSFDSSSESPYGRKGKISFLTHNIFYNEQLLTESAVNFQTRSPIDRMTHATKEHGLHRFEQIPQESTFSVDIQIINPSLDDLGFINLCEREIEYGMIRFGGVGSIGKGRLSFVNKNYDYFYKPNCKEINFLSSRSDEENKDILDCCFEKISVLDISEFKLFGNNIER